jgi:hypothetical protein
MNTADYLELKRKIKASMRNNSKLNYSDLQAQADRECTPQQKAAITRMMRQDEDDWYLREAGYTGI